MWLRWSMERSCSTTIFHNINIDVLMLPCVSSSTADSFGPTPLAAVKEKRPACLPASVSFGD
ncbi:protein of unknown function (plasmid) [Paraburkholderia dioscoreae]|uniref:Uncharacterized protein n=1 Tax=Paraburkholderia dioscoreae TaxID=2604047 RepID=A0A5Q4Z2R0_9BURK|nr:protein of unknown function [Paraburkholderia dioscoreae]